jgi:phosphoglycerol transferase MdoB-like AlkP superfamily enzyme
MPTKTPSIVSLIITTLLLLLGGGIGMFGMLVMLNGYNDSSGGPALLAGLICNIISIVLAAILAWRLPRWLAEKFNWSAVLAVGVSVLAGLIAGGILQFLSFFIGLIVADTIWNAR